eukprot:gb/GECG01008178.1/.p1 GENE.gb/GECG01008178.1/~~gb/GECG01008178.1/.p1  ORF type:complete len:4308 (+),score=574.12 gb/GECG01008178.1/:1-12924(+)
MGSREGTVELGHTAKHPQWNAVISLSDILQCRIPVRSQQVQQKLSALWHGFVEHESNEDLLEQCQTEEDVLLVLLIACRTVIPRDATNGKDPSPRAVNENTASVFLEENEEWELGVEAIYEKLHNLGVTSYSGAVARSSFRGTTSSFEIARNFIEVERRVNQRKTTVERQRTLLQDSRLFVQFAGQGNDWLGELSLTTDMISSVLPLLETMVESLKGELSKLEDSERRRHFSQGIDVLSWIEGYNGYSATPVPASEYLRSAPVSYPLIGVTQLVTFYSMYLDFHHYGAAPTWNDFLKKLGGVVGHSQGIVSGVALACSKDVDEFFAACRLAVKLLFWQGLRCEQKVAKGRHMMSIQGLSWKQLMTYLQTFVSRREGKSSTTQTDANIGCRETSGNSEVNQLEQLRIQGKGKAAKTSKEVQLDVGLINGIQAFVVTGEVNDVESFKEFLEDRQASHNEDQSRIPYSQRKPVFSVGMLPISSAFHSRVQAETVPVIQQDIENITELCKTFAVDRLNVPVYDTCSGVDIRRMDLPDLPKYLARVQAVERLDWLSVVGNLIPPSGSKSIVMDCGPGSIDGVSSVAKLTAGATVGHSVEVASCCMRSFANTRCFLDSLTKENVNIQFGLNPVFNYADVLSGRPNPFVSDWNRAYNVYRQPNSENLLSRFTSVIGTKPLIVAGMTPTTSLNGVPLVAAALNAGYEAELACGGLPRQRIFEDKIRDLAARIQPGIGITLNMLYLNAKQWSFQFPAALKLRRDDKIPIKAITIAAGVPSVEKGVEIVGECIASGMSFVGFKPGSLDAIYRVLEVAKSVPSVPVVLQWTGGRSGGHHSFEDTHAPLLASYADIRKCPNVLLVVGGGIGSGESVAPYLQGTWSQQKWAASSTFGEENIARNAPLPPMPCDAALLASRMMVSEEAATAPEVKKLIAATPGVSDDFSRNLAFEQAEWEKSYESEAGGVATVKSELGEPIHKIFNRGIKLWKEFDNRFFNIQKPEDRKKAIEASREEIIRRLNEDFQKEYFGIHKRYQSVLSKGFSCNRVSDYLDVEEMTYSEVAYRMVEFMFASPEKLDAREKERCPEGKWLDPTFKERVYRFLSRAEDTLRGMCTNDEAYEERIITTSDLLSPEQSTGAPRAILDRFFSRYEVGMKEVLTPDDLNKFYQDCKSGGKPVPFIPFINEDLQFWFKKDSLWYSEDLAAVRDRDPQRVCILQGPVSTRYSTEAEEKAEMILSNIESHVARNSKEEASPPFGVERVGLPDVPSLTILPSKETVNLLSDKMPQWLRSACRKEYTVDPKNGRWMYNPIISLLRSQQFTVMYDTHKKRVEGYAGDGPGATQVLELDCKDGTHIQLRLFDRSFKGLSLNVDMKLSQQWHYSFLLWDQDSWKQNIRKYYEKVWSCDTPSKSPLNNKFIPKTGSRIESKLGEDAVNTFLGEFGEKANDSTMPLSYLIVPAWSALAKGILSETIPGIDLLRLVHLHNSFAYISSGSKDSECTFSLKDNLVIEAGICKIAQSGGGVTVSLVGDVSCSERDSVRAEIKSEFFIRQPELDAATFVNCQVMNSAVKFVTPPLKEVDVGRIEYQPWHVHMPNSPKVSPGDVLSFDLRITAKKTSSKMMTVCSEGTVYCCGIQRNRAVSRVYQEEKMEKRGTSVELGQISIVRFLKDLCQQEIDSSVNQNELKNDMHRHWRSRYSPLGEIADASYVEHEHDSPYNVLQEPLEIHTPSSCHDYAAVSADWNPIHREGTFANLAQLPASNPIVHGMWLSTKAQLLVSAHICNGDNTRLRAWYTAFQDMVYLDSTLYLQAQHVGMTAGDLVVRISVVDKEGTSKMLAYSRISQEKTAYLFTGQGSAAPGMGMDLLQQSSVARDVWQSADRYLYGKYGFSILNIVQNNPKQLTIRFGGNKGKKVRDNYQKLTVYSEEEGKHVPILPEITSTTNSYTFKHPKGLLFATQFTQPALVIVQKAAFDDLKKKGYCTSRNYFAGHSLGEYAALASVAPLLSVETVAELVFRRGIIMQQAVKRDEAGRSNFAMVACNPTRVGSWFTEDALHLVVNLIYNRCSYLIEVVNYNSYMHQYVVAGTIKALYLFTLVLDNLSQSSAAVHQIVDDACTKVDEVESVAKSKGKHFGLYRGRATIPLDGIDVPFHSRYLRPGVSAFRQMLLEAISPEQVAFRLPEISRSYIPNLVAKPFEVTEEFANLVFKETKSPYLKPYLDSPRWGEDDCEWLMKLAHTLVIELLAYQFASPVLWIQTQNVLFERREEMKMVEFGSTPVLLGLAKRTIQNMKIPSNRLKLLLFKDSTSELRYQLEDQGPSAADHAEKLAQETVEDPPSSEDRSVNQNSEPASSESESKPFAQATTQKAQIAPQASESTQSMEDEPPKAIDSIRCIVSQKLKKPVSEISLGKSLKDLSEGKSAQMNEIAGDLAAELGVESLPEGATDESLQKVSEQFDKGNQTFPGKVTSKSIGSMVSKAMPAGMNMSSLKQLIEETWSVGKGRSSAILLYGTTSPPTARLARRDDVKQWLESVVSLYESIKNIRVPRKGEGTGAGTGASGADLSALLKLSQAGQKKTPKSIPDQPVQALSFLKALIAQKLSSSTSDISGKSTLQQLSNGKSAVQNEIAGDIEQEFGSKAVPEGAAEFAISDLAKKLQPVYDSRGLGNISKAMIGKIGNKLPAGHSLAKVRQSLKEQHGLPSGLVENVLIHSLGNLPAKRFESNDELNNWLNSMVKDYAKMENIDLSGSSNGGDEEGPDLSGLVGQLGSSGPSKEFEEYKTKLNVHIQQQAENMREFLGVDHKEITDVVAEEAESATQLQSFQSQVLEEMGEKFYDGITPKFDSKKIRQYSSYWCWNMQELSLFSAAILRAYGLLENEECLPSYCVEAKEVADEIRSYCSSACVNRITNRPTQQVLDFCTRFRNWMGKQFSDGINSESGSAEARNELFKSLEEAQTTLDDVTDKIEAALEQNTFEPTVHTNISSLKPHVSINSSGSIDYSEVASERFESYISELCASHEQGKNWIQCYHLNGDDEQGGETPISDTFFKIFGAFSNDEPSLSLGSKNVLIVGCGPGSIGAETLRLCLQGGASVFATTSRLSKNSIQHFESMYHKFGAKGSSLTIFPFNGASKQDVDSLVNHFYSQSSPVDFDIVLPFAAINEAGSKVTTLDGKSELAHRLMLTNVLRLIGKIATKKREQGLNTQPTEVILPMSPNHGIFGGDGLYAESKLGLESLFNKWHSEDWADYITIVGAIIGWTRGTSLMAANNAVAAKLEEQFSQIRTFSSEEMALNLLVFMHPTMVEMAYGGPIKADLGGGFDQVPKLQEVVASIRADLQKESKLTSALLSNEQKLKGSTSKPTHSPSIKMNRFPDLPSDTRRKKLCAVRGSLDLSQVPVIVGFGELGPWGHTRTRWDIEAYGSLSVEGCMEMAWLMGYIQWKEDDSYCGWVDSSSQETVDALDIKKKYEEKVLEHSGIRLIEPELFEGYDPLRKQFLHQVAVERTMDWVEVNSPEDAKEYTKELGDDKVDVMFLPEGQETTSDHDKFIAQGRAMLSRAPEDVPEGSWYIRVKRGAILSVPRAMRFDRWVAGQIPTGWNPQRFGIPKDLADRIDPVSLYSLVSVAESLVTAGISDPYEFYKYIHVSELGNSAGGGMGGMRALKRIFRQRREEEDIQNDILQESFINTVPAWINMLLLSSSGPIKTPVGACATAAESIDIAVDTIKSGKARVMIAGGFDDFGEEGSYEFGAMGATSNSDQENAKGRFPSEMSRPTSSSRAGFMEAQGSGMQILMAADLAIDMGCPIYAVIAHSATATDKIGRSVPAPGEGILTTARQYHSGKESPLLDLGFRSKQLQNAFSHIDRQANQHGFAGDALKESLRRSAQRQWAHDLHLRDNTISPIQGALSMFGLSANDITLASFHGTGTKANDLNESEVTDLQMRQLGRAQGNPLYVVCQKYLTGHGKGSAAAWMINGACQSLVSGIVPGNANADDVDSQFQRFSHLAYINSSIQLEDGKKGGRSSSPGVKSVLVKSFGFGQAGGELLLLHPDYLLANIGASQYESYVEKRLQRERTANRLGYNIHSGKRPLLEVKDSPPYTNDQQRSVYLNPRARATWDIEAKEHRFVTTEDLGRIPLTYGRPNVKRSRGDSIEKSTQLASFDISAKVTSSSEAIALEEEATKMAFLESSTSNVAGVGVDVEPIATFSRENPSFDTFTQRNFTEKEISLCLDRQDPESSFAGRWAAKEAVVKSISNAASGEYGASPPMWKGGEASLKDIEILSDRAGCPTVQLSGYSAEMARMGNVSEVQVSISHSGEYAIAMAYAKFDK